MERVSTERKFLTGISRVFLEMVNNLNSAAIIALRVLPIRKSGVGFLNKTRNPKNGFRRTEILFQDRFRLTNPNPDFMELLLLRSFLGNPKQDFQNFLLILFLIFVDYAHANNKPLIKRTVLQIL